MTEAQQQPKLFSDRPKDENAVVINDRCVVRTSEGHRVVVVAGIVLAQYAVGDRMAETHAMVSLVDQSWADQNDVARGFGRSTRSVRRYQQLFESGGLAALGRSGGYPAGRSRLKRSRAELVMRLKGEGLTNRAIARRLGVSEKAIRKTLRRRGWAAAVPEQESLPLDVPTADPNLSASSHRGQGAGAQTEPHPESSAKQAPDPGADPNLSALSSVPEEPVPVSFDSDPADRRFDRVLARVGLLDDAAPLFGSAPRIPHAGVLLALPALTASDIIPIATKVYGSIGPAFYGLRTTFVALLLMALLRIKRPEALKEHAPDDLGRLLGLDRAPEVKTLRRKLSRLAAFGRAAQLGQALAQRRVAERGEAMGFLYIDGHVRVYHGQRTLPKAHVARMRLAMPATTDYWVNDSRGDPLFVVTAEANAGMVKMLPLVLDEVRALVGERRITVAFDRGGYSPKLFLQLIAQGFDILTYRKGRFPRVPRSRFQEHEGIVDGRKVSYKLADQGVRLLGGKLRLRQVTRLGEDGHRTPILTSRRDLSALEVAHRMFERWRQENFFKYLREEYALDALVDYRVVADDDSREVPNPLWAQLDAKLRQARADLAPLASEYGVGAFLNPEQVRPTMRGFKIAHGKLAQRIRAAVERVRSLMAARASVPRRTKVGDVVAEVVKLAPERKLLTNIVKMVAYQAESDLVRLLAPHYKRVEDEGRTLIQTALSSAADIEVTQTELRVTLAPLSSRHRTRAIAALCHELDQTGVRFPGTKLRMRYAVASPR